MIPIQITFTSYDKVRNTCMAVTSDGKEYEVDPFVGCAIYMTDEEYEAGKGADVVGKTYIMTAYSVYPHNIVPHDGGLVAV